MPGGSGIFDDLIDTPAPAPEPAPEPAGPSGLFDDLVDPAVAAGRPGIDRPAYDFDAPPSGGNAPRLAPSLGSDISNTRGFELASNLSPWVLGGPVGVAAAVGTDVGDRYSRMRALGYGPAAAGAAGVAQGGLELASGGVAKFILGKPAAMLGAGLADAVGGRAGAALGGGLEHGVVGGGTGELMGLGTGTVSAATGDPNAAAEFRSAGEQGLMLGGLSAGLGMAGGGLAGRGGDVRARLEERGNAAAAEPAPAPAEAAPAPVEAPQTHIFDDLVEPPADLGVPEAPAEPPVVAAPAEAPAPGQQGIFADLVEPSPEPSPAPEAPVEAPPIATTETGSHALPETTLPHEVPPEAAAQPQGPLGEPAPQGDGGQAEVGQGPREPAPAVDAPRLPEVAPAPPAAPAAPVAPEGAPRAPDSPSLPVADQRATSLRPDLAIPSAEPAVREAFKRVDERRTLGGEPQVRSRASQREAAAERMASDAGGEAATVVAKVMRGDALNEQEMHILRTTGERHQAAGDIVEAEKHYELYRAARTEGARAHGYGGDPSEPPAKRAQNAVVQQIMAPDKATKDLMDAALREKNSAKYDALLKHHLTTVKQHLADIAKLSGVDPLDLAQEKAPKASKPTIKERTQSAILTVDREYRDLLKKFKDSFRTTGSAGALGGEQLTLLASIITNRIKAGVLRAADAALDLAKVLPRIKRDVEMQKAFAAEWEKQTGEKIDGAKLFEPSVADQRKAALEKLAKVAESHASGQGSDPRVVKSKNPEVQAILDTANELRAEIRARDAKPSPTLEQRVGAARDRLAAAVDRHAEAMGQTDAERTQTIAERRAKPELPPEAKTIVDEIARLGKEVSKRDQTLEPPKTLDERIKAAQKALDAATERHHKAMGETPAERLAAIEAKKAAKEPIHPEVQALLDERKALDSAVRARDRLVYRNALRVLDASRTLKANGWDKFDELYRNGLHTSFGLPWYKIGSDIVNKIHTWIADDLGAALLNHIIPGGSDPRSLADAPYILKGIIPGLVKGAQAGLHGLREDRNVFADDIRGARAAASKKGFIEGLEDPSEFHQQTHALGTVAHNVTGWNMRLIQGIQTGAESAFAHAQVAAEAHRLAVDAEGNRLTGEALQRHMEAQIEDQTSPAWTNAVKVAHRDTSVTSPTPINPVYWVNKVKNAKLRDNNAIMSTPGAFPALRTAQSAMRAVIPFTVVPTNLVVRGIYNMTPLNGASIALRTLRGALHLTGAKGGAPYLRAQFNTDASRHLLGWLVVAGISSALYDKDGNRRITGYAYNKVANDQGQPPPHSVNVNGKWWDYGKILGAGGHALGAIVDAFDAVHSLVAPGKKAEPKEAGKEAFATLKEHVTDETFMRSIGDIVAAARSEGGFAKYVGMLASSLVPTEAKQIAKSTQDTVPDHRSKERGFGARVAQVVKQQVGAEHVPTVDAFGHETPKDDLLNGPVTAAAARIFAPIHGRVSEIGDGADPYRHLIMRWNDANPGDKIKVGTTGAEMKIDDESIELTPQQLHDLHVDAGRHTMNILKRLTLNTDAPTLRDKTALVNAIKSGQEAARSTMSFQIRKALRARPKTPAAGASE